MSEMVVEEEMDLNEAFTSMLDMVLVLIDRVRILEERSEALEHNVGVLTTQSVTMEVPESPETRAETPRPLILATEGEIEALKARISAIHALDASPLQWMTVPGSMSPVPAQPGMWRISCKGCDYETRWDDGQPAPTPCPTVRALEA